MNRNVLDWLEISAKRRPDAAAFKDQNSCVTFAQLNLNSEKIGTYLIKRTERQKPVLILMEKSPACICTMMGVVRAGCFYTPIDPAMPEDRMKLIVSVLAPACIICSEKYRETAEKLAAAFAESQEKASSESCLEKSTEAFAASSAKVSSEIPVYIQENIHEEADEEALTAVYQQHIDNDLLYVLFTSGSTGLPKGVAITHRSVIDFIDWTSATLPVDENTIFGNQAPLYFDNSVLDIYTAIRIGACVDFIPPSLFSFPGKLFSYMIEHNIDTVFWVPSALAKVASSGVLEEKIVPPLKNIFFCGEVMHCSTLNRWKKALPEAAFVNMYGPTEITDVCTFFFVDREFADDQALPIGRPCGNTRIELIDGEICVGGTCLAPGYYNAPEKTAAAFVQNPLRPQIREILYKTGDLGEYNERGELMFLGRKDSQIKKNGYRIELGEIESILYGIPEVFKGCCVFDSQSSEIICFYTGNADEKEVRRSMKKKLPKYMIPDVFVHRETLPETGNGKMDRVKISQEWKNEHSVN